MTRTKRKYPTKYQLTNEESNLIGYLAKGLKEGKNLSGADGLISNLIGKLYHHCLEAEIDHHLDSEPKTDNRRNGYTPKLVKSNFGNMEINTPRDRNSNFEANIIKKRQTVIEDEIAGKILSLYTLGTSYQDIAKHIADLYCIDVSDAMIHSITERLLPELNEWRSRPLEKQYAVLFLDAMFFKARIDGAVKTRVVYSILGVQMDGRKEILGIYLCDSEGASFWLGVLNDLKARGVEDILIACIDGLKGFPDAIKTLQRILPRFKESISSI